MDKLNEFYNYLSNEKRYSSNTVDAYKRDLSDFSLYLTALPRNIPWLRRGAMPQCKAHRPIREDIPRRCGGTPPLLQGCGEISSPKGAHKLALSGRLRRGCPKSYSLQLDALFLRRFLIENESRTYTGDDVASARLGYFVCRFLRGIAAVIKNSRLDKLTRL